MATPQASCSKSGAYRPPEETAGFVANRSSCRLGAPRHLASGRRDGGGTSSLCPPSGRPSGTERRRPSGARVKQPAIARSGGCRVAADNVARDADEFARCRARDRARDLAIGRSGMTCVRRRSRRPLRRLVGWTCGRCWPTWPGRDRSSRCGTEPVAGDRGWRPLAELYTDPEPLRSRIAHVRRVLDSDDRVAASIAFQGLAALAGVAPFAAVVLHGVLPRLGARALYWRPTAEPDRGRWAAPSRPGTRYPRSRARAPARWPAQLVGEHLGPLVAAVRARVADVAAGALGQRRVGGGRGQAAAGERTAGSRRAGGRGGRPGAGHGAARRHRGPAAAAAAGPGLDVPAALLLPVLPGARRRALRATACSLDRSWSLEPGRVQRLAALRPGAGSDHRGVRRRS